MGSILLILLVLAGILLLILLNNILLRIIFSKKYKVVIKLASGVGLIAVNLIIMFSFEGVLGKIMFLIPLILIGPSYPLLKKK